MFKNFQTFERSAIWWSFLGEIFKKWIFKTIFLGTFIFLIGDVEEHFSRILEVYSGGYLKKYL